MRPIDTIIVHASATRPSMDIGAGTIRKWHKARGWSDIGYHWVIRRDGIVEPGRPLARPGAHTRGHNRTSIGICLIGGVDVDNAPDANFTRSQYESLERVIRGSIATANGSITTILGHRDFPGVTKACPCFNVSTWWSNR